MYSYFEMLFEFGIEAEAEESYISEFEESEEYKVTNIEEGGWRI